LGQLRLLCADGPGKLVEQPYNVDGTAAGKSTQSRQQSTISMDRLMYVLEVVAMVVLLAVMLGTLKRRGALQQAGAELEQLLIAPLGARLAAGIVDIVPVVVAVIIASPTTPTPEVTAAQLTWLILGFGVYVVHCAVGEVIWGRSVGKLLFGLRVVSLNGERAGVMPVLVRNVLRVVDVPLLFPLTLMLFLPLRQRLGDLAAGTVVVREAEAQEAETEE
jgi:uncharacterized RDD family membrane protein YckC